MARDTGAYQEMEGTVKDRRAQPEIEGRTVKNGGQVTYGVHSQRY